MHDCCCCQPLIHTLTQPKSRCRNWSSIHEQRHVVIHLPSLGFLEGQRQGLSKPQVRENSQMARLCDLADPLVEVVYVAPFSLPEVGQQSACKSDTPCNSIVLAFADDPGAKAYDHAYLAWLTLLRVRLSGSIQSAQGAPSIHTYHSTRDVSSNSL